MNIHPAVFTLHPYISTGTYFATLFRWYFASLGVAATSESTLLSGTAFSLFTRSLAVLSSSLLLMYSSLNLSSCSSVKYQTHFPSTFRPLSPFPKKRSRSSKASLKMIENLIKDRISKTVLLPFDSS